MGTFTYQGAVETLLRAVPELESAYEREVKSWQGDKPGAYIVFEDLVHRFMVPLLRLDRETGVLERMFGLFEQMAASEDREAVNLLWVAELEFLIGQPELLQSAWRYMGPRTKAMAREAAAVYRCEANLPQDDPGPGECRR